MGSSVAVIYKKTTLHQGIGTTSLEVDATLSETAQFDSDVTEHPVEDGFNIADGIRNKPVSLSLDCLVSNTPIIGAQQAKDAGGYHKGNPGAAAAAFTVLQSIRDAEDVINVATALKLYKSMAVTSIKVTRDTKTGDVLSFTLALKQIRIVSSKFVSFPREPRGAKKVPLGDKAKVEVFHASTSESVASKIFKFGKSALGGK